MTTSPPLITVLLAVYNGMPYLREAVESILAQTCGDFEFLIVDDGSTDGSETILESCAARDARIRIIRHDHQGLTRSLNRGLQQARGEFIARMDADDIALPTRLEHQRRYLRENPDCVALGGQMLLVDPDGASLGYFTVPQDHDAIDQHNLAHGGGGIPHPSAMMRRSAIQQLGGYNEQHSASQDGDLFLRLAEVGRLANLPEVLLKYRLHSSSITLGRRSEQEACSRAIIAEARRRRGLPGLPSDAVILPPMLPLCELQRSWAAMALATGFHQTARKYAWLAFRNGARFRRTWWILAAALLPAWLLQKCRHVLRRGLSS